MMFDGFFEKKTRSREGLEKTRDDRGSFLPRVVAFFGELDGLITSGEHLTSIGVGRD